MTPKSNQDFLFNLYIRNDFQYGDLGLVLTLHGSIYHQQYGFNHEFEAYVAEGLAEFGRDYQEGKSRLWIAQTGDKVVGSIAIMERPHQEAQLRWFLVHPDYQGKKLGKRLLDQSIKFCQDVGYKRLFLWTLAHLKAAKSIYEKNGFKLVEQKKHSLWGKQMVEEYYVLTLTGES